ncbi:MAG: DUF21 domain-containing protein [Acidobacteria bacterium]|nr:MAG: DUF21 domain-containing protein [Acidobacteriota bacterium]
MTLLLIYVGLALGFSFLCSILEAGLLSVRTAELEERKARGQRAAALLLDLKQERVDDAISAILILNTIAHTAGATLAGAQAGKVFGDHRVGIFSAVLILLVLVVTEIIPKTIGTVYASSLVGFVARATALLVWLLRPALVLTGLVTRFFAHQEQPAISRGELAAMVALAGRQGILPAAHSQLVENALLYDRIQVADVMTPRTVLCALPASATIADFLADRRSRIYSRIPIYRDDRDHMIGYVLQRDVLAAAAEGSDPTTPLERFRRDLLELPAEASVARALRQLTAGRQHLALVRDEFGGTAGLVTLEDLIETILGVEILDEADHVADLRAEAIRLRDQRLAERRAESAVDEAPAPDGA